MKKVKNKLKQRKRMQLRRVFEEFTKALEQDPNIIPKKKRGQSAYVSVMAKTNIHQKANNFLRVGEGQKMVNTSESQPSLFFQPKSVDLTYYPKKKLVSTAPSSPAFNSHTNRPKYTIPGHSRIFRPPPNFCNSRKQSPPRPDMPSQIQINFEPNFHFELTLPSPTTSRESQMGRQPPESQMGRQPSETARSELFTQRSQKEPGAGLGGNAYTQKMHSPISRGETGRNISCESISTIPNNTSRINRPLEEDIGCVKWASTRQHYKKSPWITHKPLTIIRGNPANNKIVFSPKNALMGDTIIRPSTVQGHRKLNNSTPLSIHNFQGIPCSKFLSRPCSPANSICSLKSSISTHITDSVIGLSSLGTSVPQVAKKVEEEIRTFLVPKQIKELFYARCKDMNIGTDIQINRFTKYVSMQAVMNKLILNEAMLGPEAAKIIALILKTNATLSHLELRKNFIGNVGLEYIGESIGRSQCLVHLDVTSNQINPKGFLSFFKYLKENETISCLNIGSTEGLHRNRLALVGSKVLANILKNSPIIAFLDISGACLGDAGIKVIAQGMKANTMSSIRGLKIALNQIGPFGAEAIESILLTMPSLNILDLSSNPLGDIFLQKLARRISLARCYLHKLNIHDCSFTSSYLSDLFFNFTPETGIRSLNAKNNNLFRSDTKTSLCRLLSKNALLHLNLASCKLGDKGMFGIAGGIHKHASIQVLKLADNQITDHGFKTFCKAIERTNTSLKYFDLGHNLITYDSMEAFGNALQVNDSILSVNLSFNEIEERGIKILTPAVVSNRVILSLKVKYNSIKPPTINALQKLLNRNQRIRRAQEIDRCKYDLKKYHVQEGEYDETIQNIDGLKAQKQVENDGYFSEEGDYNYFLVEETKITKKIERKFENGKKKAKEIEEERLRIDLAIECIKRDNLDSIEMYKEQFKINNQGQFRLQQSIKGVKHEIRLREENKDKLMDYHRYALDDEERDNVYELLRFEQLSAEIASIKKELQVIANKHLQKPKTPNTPSTGKLGRFPSYEIVLDKSAETPTPKQGVKRGKGRKGSKNPKLKRRGTIRKSNLNFKLMKDNKVTKADAIKSNALKLDTLEDNSLSESSFGESNAGLTGEFTSTFALKTRLSPNSNSPRKKGKKSPRMTQTRASNPLLKPNK